MKGQKVIMEPAFMLIEGKNLIIATNKVAMKDEF